MSGKRRRPTLSAELDKSAAPTLFQCGNQGAINSYGDYCYPLDGTAIMDQMTTDAFHHRLCSNQSRGAANVGRV